MNERPILFSGPMVRAILEGRKTMTRRVVKVDAADWECDGCEPNWPMAENQYGDSERVACPYGQPGGTLWVRETWASFGDSSSITPPVSHQCQIRYHADNSCQWRDVPQGARGLYPDASFRLRPSIHMPRWASRITLEVTAVRVERLQEITEDDARAEGIVKQAHGYGVAGLHMTLSTAREAFGCLWDGINAERGFGWSVNPWVWVVEFRRV